MKDIPKIYGFNKSSEMGRDVFATSIFLKGCNLKCPYCMNASLVLGKVEKEIDIEVIKKHVMEEKVEWVMISGGEPTCNSSYSLVNLIELIKGWGCKVGMSTNGSFPMVISKIIPYLNYIAMDIKCVNSKDWEIISGNINDIIISKSILVKNKLDRADIDYEIRTTLFPSFINKTNIKEIGSIMRKDERWILQQFRHSHNMLDSKCVNVKPYTEKDVKEIVEVAREFSNNVFLKYV